MSSATYMLSLEHCSPDESHIWGLNPIFREIIIARVNGSAGERGRGRVLPIWVFAVMSNEWCRILHIWEQWGSILLFQCETFRFGCCLWAQLFCGSIYVWYLCLCQPLANCRFDGRTWGLLKPVLCRAGPEHISEGGRGDAGHLENKEKEGKLWGR